MMGPKARRLAVFAAIAAAWMPFVFLWALFASGDRDAGSALASGVIGVAPAALLSIVVWRICVWLPWPRRLTPGFYLIHLGVATAYAATWVLSTRLTYAVQTGRFIPRQFLSSRMIAMHVLTGIALYGVIAGVSYAVRISRQLRLNEQLAEQTRTLLVSARLDALRARLNPHFLFNALHTLGALVRHRPAGDAEHAIQELGEMLRYALRSGDAGVVAFRDEWDFTMRYANFQKLRFGDRLRVEEVLDGDVAEWRLPMFAVQTLVENAVKHAIEQNPAGGTVSIFGCEDSGCLRVVVRDDGPSAPPPTTEAGSGLANLRERLMAAYGDGSALTETEFPSGGREVTLRIPRALMRNAEDGE
jgi:sensor histidine kinase YesM